MHMCNFFCLKINGLDLSRATVLTTSKLEAGCALVQPVQGDVARVPHAKHAFVQHIETRFAPPLNSAMAVDCNKVS